MEIKIPVHSIIDVITNSSTEIYVNPASNTSKVIKEFIDGILKSAGSDKKCNDLFEIKIKKELNEDTGEPYEDGYDDYDTHESVTLVSKDDGKEINMKSLVYNMFNIEGSYNG